MFSVFLMNPAMIGGPSWGAKLTLKSTGTNHRSSITVEEVVYQILAAITEGTYPEPS